MIVATGPLTSPALAEAIGELTGEGALAFFDAIAPIVHRYSIDMDVAWMQSRYDKEGPSGGAAAYVNCPMSRERYEAFVDAVLAAEKTEFREFEGTPYFDGCLPIEVMAERGRETLRHGPMKPFGLTNAHAPDRQALRRRAAEAGQRARNPVQHGRFPDQAQIWRAGPHLPHDPRASSARSSRGSAASIATPTSIRPKLLDGRLRLKAAPGCASPARSPAARAMSRAPRSGLSRDASPPPNGSAGSSRPRRRTTAIGALINHITGGHIESIDAGPRSFQPMNVNFGLFPPIVEPRIDEAGKRLRGPERGLGAQARAVGPGGTGFGGVDCFRRRWRTSAGSLTSGRDSAIVAAFVERGERDQRSRLQREPLP